MTRDLYQIRPATAEDSKRLVGMQRELAQYCGYSDDGFHLTDEIIRSTILHDEQAHYFVAEQNEETAGMMLCHRVPLGWQGNSGVYIEDLFVRPEHRNGRGVGKLLAARACELALNYAGGNADRAFVRLDTGVMDNEDTLKFYRKLGMTEDNINFRLHGRALLNLVLLHGASYE